MAVSRYQKADSIATPAGSIPSTPTSEKCRFESVSSLIGKTTRQGDGGSSPLLSVIRQHIHVIWTGSSMVEPSTVNRVVEGSSPSLSAQAHLA